MSSESPQHPAQQHIPANKSSLTTLRRSRSGGPGKKGKIFSESLGQAHLLSLASAAGSTEDDRNSQRIEKNRESADWKKRKGAEKRNKKSGGFEGDAKKVKSNTIDPPSGSSSVARTKAVIRAELKVRAREKRKLRKERRKQLAGEVKAYDSDDEETKIAKELGPMKNQPARKYKQVSFA